MNLFVSLKHNGTNNFVTLPPHIVHSLFTSSTSNFVTYLPLEVEWVYRDIESNSGGEKRIGYLGWAGEASSSRDTIEISSKFAECLGIIYSFFIFTLFTLFLIFK
eukprot:TRINITY_DN5204_c0_g1_i1.p1 TRINITY_DN5204_c0_g1~~TRINITY_DN5204_c0_g1_i1.p1  ORF type:complete len:119 (+),score=24.40 TRINITY_DN5204_c0_g1_i1:45-359(+)